MMNTAPQLYRNSMIEIKQRFRAVERVLGAKNPRTLNAKSDDEFMWLQLRKIVELVTFGGILADESRYASLRTLLNHQDYRLDSKVNKILPKLAEITPHYLPVPIGGHTTSAQGVMEFQRGIAQETLARFLDIFNTASLYLHVPNPLDSETRTNFQQTQQAARRRIEAELQYLKAVLWKHAKIGLAFDETLDSPKQAGKPSLAWLVDFGNPENDGITMFLAEGKD
jgi:hypothetical protein